MKSCGRKVSHLTVQFICQKPIIIVCIEKIVFRGALACFHHAPKRYNGLVKRYLYWLIAAVLLILGVGTVLYRTFIGAQ